MTSSALSSWRKLQHQPTYRTNLKIREVVIDSIRQYFKQAGFTEIDTPMLVKYPGTEPFLEVFESEIQIANHGAQRSFLLTSPEFALKKLVAGGIGSCFEICKSFRNGEGISTTHNHEFTILEWYHVDGDYTDVMRDFEELMQTIAQKLLEQSGIQHAVHTEGSDVLLRYQNQEYVLSSPCERLSIAEAFSRYAHVAEADVHDETKLPQVARKKGLSQSADLTWEEAFHLIMLNEIEPHLGQSRPTILYDYPTPLAALAKRKASDPRYAERFEVYLAGLELGNAFSELTDAEEQENRFRAELAERDGLGKTPYGLDEDYLAALKSGLPPTGGIAVGVDRLVMLFADTTDISDVITFPTAELFSVVQ